jgi:hypothetical protein
LFVELKITNFDTMDEIIIQLEKKLYRKLLLISLQNHTTVSETINVILADTLFQEEKKKQRDVKITKKLIQIYDVYKSILNEWENNFMLSLIENQFELSDKQITQVEKITLKHPSLYKELGI